jgi:hypothetical protein
MELTEAKCWLGGTKERLLCFPLPFSYGFVHLHSSQPTQATLEKQSLFFLPSFKICTKAGTWEQAFYGLYHEHQHAALTQPTSDTWWFFM